MAQTVREQVLPLPQTLDFEFFSGPLFFEDPLLHSNAMMILFLAGFICPSFGHEFPPSYVAGIRLDNPTMTNHVLWVFLCRRLVC